MSFRKNPAQQMSLFDTTYNLTEREKRALERSRAKVFSEDVFPYIVEMVNRARTQARMNTEQFKLLARIRNGVETVPSALKNIYNVNHMPVRGKIPCKHFFGSKIAALNFRKLLRFRQGTGHYGQNPLLACVKAGNILTIQAEILLFTCLNANLYAIYIQFSRFLEKRRFTPEGFAPYINIYYIYIFINTGQLKELPR